MLLFPSAKQASTNAYTTFLESGLLWIGLTLFPEFLARANQVIKEASAKAGGR
jgi:hypothetical protein